MEIRIPTSFIILMILVVQQNAEPIEYCNNSQCIHEASNVMRYADLTADPCDNFYQFACGSMLENAATYDKLPLPLKLNDLNDQELPKLYGEEIREDDHKVVKAAKQLYKACVTAPNRVFGISIDSLKQTLEKVGGWPLAEGSNWKEENFDWLNATYKLRELGYDYSSLLKLDVVVDPENEEKYIFKLENSYVKELDQNYIKDTIKLFGSDDGDDVKEQLKELQEFVDKLNAGYSVFAGDYKRFTVNEFQKEEGSIDWLDYINIIVGKQAQITKDDYVVFPLPSYFKFFFDLLSRTSKRTQANYLLWKAIEPALNFFDDIIKDNYNQHNSISYSDRKNLRSKFCYKETRARFAPDPIEVLYAKRHFPEADRKGIYELAENVKLAYVNAINDAEWIAKKDKQGFLDQINKLKMVLGLPGDYDKILDDLNVDPTTAGDEPFDLLAQATKNRQTIVYNQIKKVPSENLFEKSFVKKSVFVEAHDDILYIPATVVSNKLLYNSKRAQYLNYANLGRILGLSLAEIFMKQIKHSSLQTQAGYNQTRQCLKVEGFDHEWSLAMAISDQITYAAYEKWANANSQEPSLKQLDYSPKQLFWISGQSLWCFPSGEQSAWQAIDGNEFQKLLQVLKRLLSRNPNIGRDFNCPTGSPMNPAEKCSIF